MVSNFMLRMYLRVEMKHYQTSYKTIIISSIQCSNLFPHLSKIYFVSMTAQIFKKSSFQFLLGQPLNNFLHNFENLCVRSVSKVRIMRNIQASLQNHQGVINFSKAYYTYLNIRTFVYTNSLIILCSPNVRRNACLRCYIFPCHKI